MGLSPCLLSSLSHLEAMGAALRLSCRWIEAGTAFAVLPY